jgi:hypothetical protein
VIELDSSLADLLDPSLEDLDALVYRVTWSTDAWAVPPPNPISAEVLKLAEREGIETFPPGCFSRVDEPNGVIYCSEDRFTAFVHKLTQFANGYATGPRSSERTIAATLGLPLEPALVEPTDFDNLKVGSALLRCRVLSLDLCRDVLQISSLPDKDDGSRLVEFLRSIGRGIGAIRFSTTWGVPHASLALFDATYLADAETRAVEFNDNDMKKACTDLGILHVN